MGLRAVKLCASAAVVVAATRCSFDECSGVHQGARCRESQVGVACADSTGCNPLVCDGVEFGSQPASQGASCTQAGLVCPRTPSDPCNDLAFVCDGARFNLQATAAVGPGATCNRAGLVCHWPGTECDSCTCNGSTFVCKENCCTTSCMDGGPPAGCPPPELVVDGQSCSGGDVCAGSACDGGSSMCTCASGTWSCQCVATPVALVSGENPSGLAADGTYVYWTDYLSGLVRRIAVGGGTAETIASAQSSPSSLTVDSTSAYWLNTGNAGGVMKVALAGGTPVALASNPQMPGDIAVDATSVYWTNDKSVMKVPLGGGPPVTLASSSQPVYGIAVDVTNVYWAAAGLISKTPVGGGASTSMGFALGFQLAVDATNLYWADSASIMKMSLSGGAAVVLASNQDGPNDIAVDSNAAYWVDVYGGMVMKVPLSGSTPIPLAIGEINPERIAIDATNVYWISASGIMTTPK